MSWNSLRRTIRHCVLERGGHRRAEQRRHARQHLGGDQRPLGPAVQVFGTALGGQRAAMEFEIHLADPDRQVAGVGMSCSAPNHVGDIDRRASPARPGNRPSAAGARASPRSARRRRRRSRRRAGSRGAWTLPRKLRQVSTDGARAGLGIVAADRIVEGVRQHPAAVEPLPPEQVEGHPVGLRPVDLDGEEVVDAGKPAGAGAERARSRSSRAASRPCGGGRRCARNSAGRREAGGRRIRRSACWCPARPTWRRSAPTGRPRPAP